MGFARRMLRSVIDSDLVALDRLHETYKWIPNSNRIRPSEAKLAQKRAKLAEIEANWVNFTDYIRFSVFGEPYIDVIDRRSGQPKKAMATPFVEYPGTIRKVFVPNEFPYDLMEGHHWCLWYNALTQPHEATITMEIQQLLQEHLHGSTTFDFAW